VSTLNVDKVDPSTGTALELGTSGDTITVPTGAGLTVVDEVKTNKVSPATGTAFALGDSGDTFTVPSGATIVNSGTATGFGITSASFLPTAAPLIINGDMQVAQRGTSTTSITATGFHTCDRWKIEDSTDATLTNTQESLTSGDAFADGFSKSIKYDVTTADASLGASQYAFLRYNFEGQDMQLFKKGSSTAETYTVSFWVKSTKTGTQILEFWDTTNSRSCCKSYTIDTTDTWEYKVLNYPADTTGAIANTNAGGMGLFFWLCAGSNYTGGTLSTTWTAYSDTNRAVGQVNNFDSTSNNFEITGVQLEVGTYTSSDLPPFRHESYGDNLRRCQRYFCKISPKLSSVTGRGYQASGAVITNRFQFATVMRTEPTCAIAGTWNVTNLTGNPAFNSFDVSGFTLGATTSGAGDAYYYPDGTDDYLTASAEL